MTHRHPRRDGERGSADLVLTLPVAFAMVVMVFQVGLWTHAHARAQAIADRALAAARAYNATTAAGYAAADAAVAQVGGELLHGPRVNIARGTGRVTVTVEATTIGLVPGWNPRVTAHQAGAIEHWETRP